MGQLQAGSGVSFGAWVVQSNVGSDGFFKSDPPRPSSGGTKGTAERVASVTALFSPCSLELGFLVSGYRVEGGEE